MVSQGKIWMSVSAPIESLHINTSKIGCWKIKFKTKSLPGQSGKQFNV